MARSVRAGIAGAIVLVAVAAAGGAATALLRGSRRTEAARPPPAPPAAPAFVGSETCAACHRAEHDAWKGSQHARAIQRATPGAVRGDFGGATFTAGGVRTTFHRREGRPVVRTDGPDGKLADFEVAFTFGVEPLQQYLVELPGGRLQALPIAWDARPAAEGGQRWFHLYPGERVDHRGELHWTKPAQGWNHVCADCHSTDVRKGYDAATDRFATRWSELTVGCEACHGPGSAHVAWARSPRDARGGNGLTVALDERRGVTWGLDPATGAVTRSRARAGDREIEACAPCHSRRAQLAEGHRAGDPLLDHYRPTPIVPDLYHPDGQQRGEVYVWGSFLQSRMYRAGVTCSDCHDPHSEGLRAEGNALCTRCHVAAVYDGPRHHLHAAGSAGASCVACHMPATPYMVIDPRRDHRLGVPRPDLSVALGVPNACTGCHRGRSARWAADAVRRGYGRDARGLQSFGEAFHAAETGRPGAGTALAALVADGGQPAIVRASALARLEGRAEPAAAGAALAGARDPSPLVRLAAATVAGSLPPRERAAVAGPLLADPLRAIRVEAAGALAGIPLDALGPDARAAWPRAVDDYVAAQRYAADRPEARTNLGTFYARLGRAGDAEAEFAAAARLDPAYVPAYVNAADAYREQGREDDAVRWLEAGLAAAPASAALHHALGLAQARRHEGAAALRSLARAARLEPTNARYAYVHAVALHSLGRTSEAIAALERAARRWPADRDVLLALAVARRDAGRLAAARDAARALLAAHPDDPEARALAAELE
jgi:predicted CXXCH cytochrome family protein